MAVTLKNYTRKGPDLEVLVVTNLQETYDWLIANLPDNYQVNITASMGMLSFTDGTVYSTIYQGGTIARDANGKIFKIEKDLLNALFDEVPLQPEDLE